MSVLVVALSLAAPPPILPPPQCLQPGEGPALTIDPTSAPSLPAGSDDSFAAAWLKDGIAVACGGMDATSGAAQGEQVAAHISLLLPGPEQTAALEARGLETPLGRSIGEEGYVMDARTGDHGGVLIAAQNRSGLLHGVQTLLQSLRPPDSGSGSCQLAPVTIEDYPDSPMRGVYWVGSWFDAFPANVSFLNHTFDEMAKYKHSFAMFNGNGAMELFSALLSPDSDHGRAVKAYYKHWQTYAAERGIELIPQINAGNSGPNDVVNADISEGVWVRDEPFIAGSDFAAVHSPAASLNNGNFSDGLSGWKILKHGDNPGEAAADVDQIAVSRADDPLCWHNDSFGPSPGLGSAMCSFTGQTPAAPHTLTLGLQSQPFPVDKGEILAWSAWVYTECGEGCSDAVSIGGMFQFSVDQLGTHDAMPPQDYHRGSGQPMGRSSIGKWSKLSGTLLGSDAGNGSAYVLAWIDGNVTGTFAIANIRILRLNSALVNVIRTNASDINVTSDDGVMYQRGVDYLIEDAPKRNVAKDVDLVEVFDTGNVFKLRRLPGGKIKDGQRVLLSMDILGGLVGQIGDGSHCNSFAEPLYYEWMDKVIAFTMDLLHSKKIFFGFDEMVSTASTTYQPLVVC